MRISLSALSLALLVALMGCENAPSDVEQPPAADAPEGTESGGAVVGTTELPVSHFGAEFTLTSGSVKVKDLLADPGSFVTGEPMLVEGTVVDVCSKAGCWLVLSDGSSQIRVTVKEHGFAVDKEGAGSWAKIEGILEMVEPDPETVAHFEGESRRPDMIPEKAGQKFQLIATGVSMQKPADAASGS